MLSRALGLCANSLYAYAKTLEEQPLLIELNSGVERIKLFVGRSDVMFWV